MKKYIFNTEQVKREELFPIQLLEMTEEIPVEFKTEEFVIAELENFDFEKIYYDKSVNRIKEKNKARLFKEGLYTPKSGEIFHEDTQEFTTIEKPSKWHTWNGKEWEVNIEEVKKIKRLELKRMRERKISENIEVHGSIFQVREKDLENFEDVARAIRRKKKSGEDTRAWILADDTIKEFTYAQLLDVLDERALRKEKIFNEYGALTIKLQQCNSVEEIEKISWEVEE